eukprot:NODE_5503_length_939_cov_155.715686_g5281_i0.p1 GENE.NODE_5503_length_939_cov_155.715686_g5281_i0~~NODE_5503_length_939_cov_155.715686_g5281_i0.p1  ORF type:complete len:251 (+),score=23.12 NODE_5503_length_939_cov_155.715686_g5281_i0:69-821(+)
MNVKDLVQAVGVGKQGEQAFKEGYSAVRSHRDEFNLVGGVALSFVGGSYMMSMVALEAIRAAGVNNLIETLKRLHAHATHALQGPADETAEARNQLYGVFLAATAAIRSRLARAVVFGCAIGESVGKYLQPVLSPIVERFVPRDYVTHVPMILMGTFKGIGMCLTWRLQRHVTAIQCGLHGAELISTSLRSITGRQGKTDLRVYRATGLAVAAVGVGYQLSRGFRPPGLAGLLMPINLLESAITQLMLSL